jgi:drug/metabolite transporter (DMT)-like permease
MIPEQNIRKSKIIGALAISIAAVMWGFDGIVLTPSLYNLNVGFVVFMLHLIPFLIMNVFLYKEYRKLQEFTPSDYFIFFLIAIFGGVMGTMAIVKALFLVNFQQLTIIILLQKLQPVFAIALATILLKERLRKYYIVWASIAIIASYFLAFGGSIPDFKTDTNMIYAALFSLLAAFSFGSSTVFSKKALRKYTFHTATFFRYGFTVLIMLGFVLITGHIIQINEVTTRNWIFFLIIALTTGSGAIFLYYFGLKRVRAIISTICELFFPVSAIIFDYIFNNQILSYVQWISAGIMIFAIVNLNRRNSSRMNE